MNISSPSSLIRALDLAREIQVVNSGTVKKTSAAVYSTIAGLLIATPAPRECPICYTTLDSLYILHDPEEGKPLSRLYHRVCRPCLQQITECPFCQNGSLPPRLMNIKAERGPVARSLALLAELGSLSERGLANLMNQTNRTPSQHFSQM